MRYCAGLILALVVAGCTSRTQQEVSIFNGMSREAFLKVVSDAGGKDITSGMALASNGREIKELYWKFEDYKVFLCTDFSDGSLKGLTYWKYEDFVRSKSDQAEKGRTTVSVRLIPERKEFKAK